MAAICNEGRNSFIESEVAKGTAYTRASGDKTSACYAFSCAVFLALSVSAFAGTADADGGVGPEIHATGLVLSDRSVYEAVPQTPVFRAFLPYSVDLSKSFPKPRDQGNLGSCTAWAVGYAARSYYMSATEYLPISQPRNIPSPAYIYDSVRRDEDCSGGISIPSALDLLENGSLSLAEAPYSDKRCKRPTEAQVESATGFRIRGWKRVDYRNLDQLKAQLVEGNPVVIGIRETPKSFFALRGSKTYKWNGEAGYPDSAHAMTIVGYDDKRQAFRLINSWGQRWGDRGFAWIAYGTISKLIYEAYVMDVAERPIPIPEPRPDIEPIELPSLDVSKFECAKLSVARDKEHPVVSGFVGYQADLDKIEDAARKANAVSHVQLRPWPQCEAMLTLSDFLARPDAPALQVAQGRTVVKSGEALTMTVTTPPHPTYLYLSYIQADGSVVNLLQPEGAVPSPLAARSSFVFGDGEEGRSRFTIGQPYGREMVIAIAAKSPLFPTPLPRTQTEREYLSAMRTALYATPEGDAGPRIAAGTIAAVETVEKSK